MILFNGNSIGFVLEVTKMKLFFFSCQFPSTPSSEIAPAKPPRPAPQTHHAQPQAQNPPELPQKKKSGDVNQRSSTDSSGSDGTEQVEQVMNDSCQSSY